MYRGRIAVVILGVLVMALLLQYHRSNGLLKLIQNTNEINYHGEFKVFPRNTPDSSERFLIVYNHSFPDSVALKDNVVKTLNYTQKDVETIDVQHFRVSDEYDCIVIAMENLDLIPAFEKVPDYVRNGGSVFIACRPLPGAALRKMASYLGIRTVTDQMNNDVVGLKLYSNLLIHGKGKELDQDFFSNSSLVLSLDGTSLLHMTSMNDLPLAWEKSWGQGKFIFYNGTSLGEKVNRGLLLGLLSRVNSIFIYPVMGVKIVNIDDFPAPMPEGHDEMIFHDYGLTIQEFYRQIWWPDMLKIANRYDIHYTGLFIESYNNRVTPPFQSLTGNNISENLLIYGRELLKSGGELGLHGYNHQPLVPLNWIKQDLGYNHWESVDSMQESVKEAKRYFEMVYPSYSIKAYVPPSNILSPDGRQALTNTLPDLEIISSLYLGEDGDSYIQEYEQSSDGILEIPRITYGFLRDDYNDWSSWNTLSYLGIFSHFVHPDDILDDQRNSGLSWNQLFKGYEDLFRNLDAQYPWLKGCTLSEAGEYLKDFLNVQYSVEQNNNSLMIASGGYRGKMSFILKTDKTVKADRNCEVVSLDGFNYLVTVRESEAYLTLESEGTQ